MAHIGLPTGATGIRPRIRLSPLGAGVTLVVGFSATIWCGLFALLS